MTKERVDLSTNVEMTARPNRGRQWWDEETIAAADAVSITLEVAEHDQILQHCCAKPNG
jgi:hypothetical protein